MDIQEFERQVDAYLDDELPAPVRIRFEAAVAADPVLATRLRRRKALDCAFRRAVFETGSVLAADGTPARRAWDLPRFAPWVASGLAAAAAVFALPGLLLVRTETAIDAGNGAAPVLLKAEAAPKAVPALAASAPAPRAKAFRESPFQLARLQVGGQLLDAPLSIAEIDLEGTDSIPAGELLRALMTDAARPGPGQGRYARVHAELLAPDPADALAVPASVMQGPGESRILGGAAFRGDGFRVQFSSVPYGR